MRPVVIGHTPDPFGPLSIAKVSLFTPPLNLYASFEFVVMLHSEAYLEGEEGEVGRRTHGAG